jgi:hypothetical protein
MPTQGVQPLALRKVGPDGVIGLDRLNGGDAEAIARCGGSRLILVRSGGRVRRISQRGTFLRGHLGLFGPGVPVSPCQIHGPTVEPLGDAGIRICTESAY